MDHEQVRDATTAEEMRAEICRLGKYVSLVHSVMNMADYKGLSAEDRYTILAYHALKESQKARELLLQQYSMIAQPIAVIGNT